MYKYEFMSRLEQLLSDVPNDERQEALRYYDDYISGDGTEAEEKIIAELESPEQIAKSIKANLCGGDTTFESAEYTDTGYHNPAFDFEKEVPTTETQWNQEEHPSRKSYNSSKIILIVILCIVASPFILSVGGAILGVVLGLGGVIIGLIAAFGGVAIALVAGAIGLFALGCTNLVINPGFGILCFGGSLLLIAIGILFVILVVLICGKLIPAIARLIGSIYHRIGRKEKMA